jgi:hypothetical protein
MRCDQLLSVSDDGDIQGVKGFAGVIFIEILAAASTVRQSSPLMTASVRITERRQQEHFGHWTGSMMLNRNPSGVEFKTARGLWHIHEFA